MKVRWSFITIDFKYYLCTCLLYAERSPIGQCWWLMYWSWTPTKTIFFEEILPKMSSDTNKYVCSDLNVLPCHVIISCVWRHHTLWSRSCTASVSGSVEMGSAVLISFSARSRYFRRSSISRRACNEGTSRSLSTDVWQTFYMGE